MPPKFTANPQRPSRYRAGKPTQPESSSESESESDNGSDGEQKQKKAPAVPPAARKPTGAGTIISTGPNSKSAVAPRKPVARVDAASQARAEAELRAKEDGFVTESEQSKSGESEEEGSDDESGSGSGSSSSEDEAPRRRLMMRPKFIPKSQRNAAQDASTGEAKVDDEDDAATRQAALDAAIEEQVRKDAAAKTSGRKHWEDDSDAEPGSDFVDDTDDIEPEVEYAAWKVRELKRLKREREAIEEREREVEEKERRMALTEEERRAEDEAKIAKQREEQANRGKMGYMQKYFHKGAFFADDTAREGLDKRDLAGVRFQDDVKNRELLPQALQMRDMTKLGKRGATKYKDLRSEDTGRWGDGQGKDRYGRGFGNRFDGDERFRPDNDSGGGGYGPDGAKGANAIPLGDRKEDSRSDRYQERHRGDSKDRDGRKFRSRSRSRSPKRQDRRDYDRDRRDSRSPRDKRDSSRDRRKRSTSRGGGRYGDDGDKRRRIDTR